MCPSSVRKLLITMQSTGLRLTPLEGKRGWVCTRVTGPRLALGDGSGYFSGRLSHNASVRKQLSVVLQHAAGSEKHLLAVGNCWKHPTIAR